MHKRNEMAGGFLSGLRGSLRDGLPGLLRPRDGRRIGGGAQKGFTLIELTVVATITTIVTVFGARLVAERALETTAETTGAYMNNVSGALQNYLTVNFNALANNVAVPGFAAPLAPTVAELRTAGHLNAAFPLFTPFNSPLNIQVIRTNCPGATCRLDGVATQAAPILYPDGQPRYSIAGVVRDNTVGGLTSDIFRTNRVAGPTGDFANPQGAQGGVVGFVTSLDTALFNQFVLRNDTRLTTLNEALTVNAGPLATGGVALNVNGNQANTGNLTVGGTAAVTGLITATGGVRSIGAVTVRNAANTANCVQMTNTGVVTITCTGTLNARTGVFTDGGGNTTTIAPTGITATGRVAAAQGLSTATATLFDAANDDRITVTGTEAFIFGSGGRLVSFQNGDVVAQKNISGQRMSLRSVVTAGAACAVTSDPLATGVEFAATSTGSMAVCTGGRWVPLQEIANQGAACPTDGAVAVEDTTYVGLICRGGRWTRTMSLLSSFVLIKTEAVTNDDIIDQPVCVANGGAFAGVPLLLLQAGNEGSPDSTFNRFAQVASPTTWRIKLVDVNGVGLGGARAIAMSYCLYSA